MKISNNIKKVSFYANANRSTDLTFANESDFIKPEIILHDFNLENTLNDKSRKIYYISDIHINHKLLKKFPKHLSENKIMDYIRKLVSNLVSSADNRNFEDYLLIGGDISFNYEVSKIFYGELRKCWGKNIVVILGNHELWNFTKDGKEIKPALRLENIIDKYRELFKSLDIKFLQNELFLLDSNYIWDSYKYKIIAEEQIINMTEEELKNACLKCRLAILGGLGFSGYNHRFNASSGIYRHTISTIDEDMEQSNKFNTIYKKLEKVIPNNNLIVFTHTPKTDWSDTYYNSNWVYVNGHTHKNAYFCDESKTVYADNQIGYYSISMGLKFFKNSQNYDIFKYYNDGIYEISRDEYIEFNLGQKIKMTFNRKNGTIKMLKRQGLYCFFFENTENSKLYLLNGGSINKLESNNINYYFDRMIDYSNIIKKTFKGYNDYIKNISNSIKQIGGSGEIHGCIVDIDFLNHIYVNPIDGKVSPYYALSIVDKYVYSNISTLLLKRRKDLYRNFTKLLKEQNDGILLLEGKKEINTAINIDISTYISDTNMYTPSRIMKTLQYLTDGNIIRIWRDDLLDKYVEQQNKEKIYLK